MRIFRLISFIVVISALLDVLLAMSDRGQPKTFETERGKCLTFNRYSHGRRKLKRLRLEKCALNNDDPDQWIYIRKVNKHEGVFYNFAGNQIIGFNAHKNKFQITERVDLYRGGESTYLRRDSPAYFLRVKLEKLWKKYERCKKKNVKCSKKKKWRLVSNMKVLLKDSNVDKIMTIDEAKWIIQRPRLKIRHKRRKFRKINDMFFNLQDKLFQNGYYKIQVNLNSTSVVSMKEKFM